MKPSNAGAAAFALIAILYSFTGLRGGAIDTCKWFNDNINADRSVGTMTRQTDLLYNRIALPVGENVAVGNTAVTNEGEQVVDFKIGSATICSTAEALYGPTPSPSPAP
jgi:hypothetical protein